MKITGKYIKVFDADRQCYIFEHDKVWLDANGFSNLNSITEYEDGNYVIHHKNGNKSDNRIENLQLVTRAEHASLHAQFRPDDYGKKISSKLIGIPKSAETRRKMSDAQKSNPSRSMLGKHHSEKSRKQIAESNRVVWQNKSQEEKDRLRELNRQKHLGKPAHNKGVPCPTKQKEHLSTLWKQRYADGYISPSKGRIFVTNGVENHQILLEELDMYLSKGFVRGLTRRVK